MMMPEFLRRAIASRHVAEHEDYLVQNYLRLLREDSAAVREELNEVKPSGFSRGGRHVFGRLVMVLLIGCALTVGAVWWRYADGAEQFREGFREGTVAGRTAR